MTTSDENFWHLFDELDGRRNGHLKQRAAAFRMLSPAGPGDSDATAHSAWRAYCDSVNGLEASLEELERLIWRMT
jgi:hypothetical protein